MVKLAWDLPRKNIFEEIAYRRWVLNQMRYHLNGAKTAFAFTSWISFYRSGIKLMRELKELEKIAQMGQSATPLHVSGA